MSREARPKLPFWVHQAVEYLLGALVITQAVRSPSPAVPVACGAIVIVLAATADGPMAVSKLVSRPVHRWLDLVVAVALAVSAVVFYSRLGAVAVGFVVATAVALGALTLRTDHRVKPPRPPREPRTASVSGDDIGRVAGRLAAKGVRSARLAAQRRRR